MLVLHDDPRTSKTSHRRVEVRAIFTADARFSLHRNAAILVGRILGDATSIGNAVGLSLRPSEESGFLRSLA